MLLAIWREMIFKSVPLGSDVPLEHLAGPDLSGAEIKNVVINAARPALCRGVDGEIEMSDFEEALRIEKEGAWAQRRPQGIGFSTG